MTHFYAWHETSLGRWERPLTGQETFHLQLALCHYGTEQFLCSVIKLGVDYSISKEDIPRYLRRAWIETRFRQPGAACTADREKLVKAYEVPDERAMEDWLASSLHILPDVNEASSTFPGEPISSARLYWLPRSSEVMFRAPHWLVDGMGIVSFWHEFFKLIEAEMEETNHFMDETPQLAWGEEFDRLGPTMEELWGYDPEHPTSRTSTTVTDLIASWTASLPSIGLPSRSGPDTLPNKPVQIKMQLDRPTTAKIVSACNERKISIAAAVEAAFILANVIHADPTLEDRPYLAVHNFNLRPDLPKPYSTSSFALNSYYHSWTFSLPLPTTFDVASREVYKDYRSIFKGDDREHYRLAVGHLCQIMASAPLTPEYNNPPPANAIPSSLGIVDRHLRHEYADGRWKIETFDLASDLCGGQAEMFWYTFREEMRFSYVFNEAMCERRHVEGLLESVRQTLVDELVVH